MTIAIRKNQSVLPLWNPTYDFLFYKGNKYKRLAWPYCMRSTLEIKNLLCISPTKRWFSRIDKYKERLFRILRVIPKSRIMPSKDLKFKRDTEPKSNKLILILNPNSQGGATGKNWKTTYQKIKRFLPNPHRIIFTKKADDGTNVTRKLLEQGYCDIAAVGGDGTINEVANGFFKIKLRNRSAMDPMKFRSMGKLSLVNAKAVFWILPSGSRNVLATSLDIKHQGIESFKHISLMKKRKMDVIGVTIADKNNPGTTLNRIVLNAAEMGVGAEIISRSKKFRGKINSRSISTVAAIVSTLPTYESNECDIIMDGGRKITSNVTMAVVANGKFLGGGFNVAPRADISDGKLDVVIMKNSGSLKMLQKLVEMKGDSEYLQEEDILYYQASQVTFLPKDRNMIVSLDGEPVGILPAIFKLYSRALTIKT